MAPTVTPTKDAAAVLYQPLFLSSFAFIFLLFSLPIFGKALGASAMAIGGLYSVLTVTIMVLRPLVGWALDHFGRKRFLVIALVSYTIAMGLFAFAKGLGGLYLARLVQGIAAACLWTSVRTMAADLSSYAERGQAMGRVQEISMRGSMVGVVAGFVLFSMLPEGHAWQVVFLGYALLAAVGTWRAWKAVPDTHAVSLSPVTDRRVVSRPLLALLVIVFTTGLSTAMISPIYLIFLQDKFTTDISILGWAFFPAGIIASVLPSRLGRLSDQVGRAPLMAVGLIGTGLLSLLLPRLPSLSWLIVLYALSAVGWSMAEPAEAAMVADLTGGETRGTGYGLYEFARGFGATLGPLLGGWLYDTVGQAVPFYLNGLVLLASAMWVLVLLRQPLPRASET